MAAAAVAAAACAAGDAGGAGKARARLAAAAGAAAGFVEAALAVPPAGKALAVGGEPVTTSMDDGLLAAGWPAERGPSEAPPAAALGPTDAGPAPRRPALAGTALEPARSKRASRPSAKASPMSAMH